MINDFMKVFNIKTNIAMAAILKVDPSSIRRWRAHEKKTPPYILVSVWAEWRLRLAKELVEDCHDVHVIVDFMNSEYPDNEKKIKVKK